MRVCDVVKNSVWFDPRVNKQIRSYTAAGCELLCLGVSCERYDEEEIKKLPCEVQIVAVPEKYYSPRRNILTKIIRELKSNREIIKRILGFKPEIIHANDLNAVIPAFIAARRLKCGLVYDSHEIFLENYGIVENKAVRFIYSLFEGYIIRRVDAVVCVSHAAAEYLAKRYEIDRPMVITNCVSEKSCIADCEVQKAERRQILNHGQFYKGRGYDLMLETAPRLSSYPELQLVLRGFGVMEEKLKHRARELHADNVLFAPPVSVHELIPKAAEAFLGLAITEAISINFKLSVSNKLFEYAAAGLPVIMSDIPEHRYLNDKYKFGIILHENTPAELQKAILKLYTDKELYGECRRNAAKMTREKSWEREFSQLLKKETEISNAKQQGYGQEH